MTKAPVYATKELITAVKNGIADASGCWELTSLSPFITFFVETKSFLLLLLLFNKEKINDDGIP